MNQGNFHFRRLPVASVVTCCSVSPPTGSFLPSAMVSYPPTSMSAMMSYPPTSTSAMVSYPPTSTSAMVSYPPNSTLAMPGTYPLTSNSAMGPYPSISTMALGPCPSISTSALGTYPSTSTSPMGTYPSTSSCSAMGRIRLSNPPPGFYQSTAHQHHQLRVAAIIIESTAGRGVKIVNQIR